MSVLLYHIFIVCYHAGIRLYAVWNDKARRWAEGRKNWRSRLSASWPYSGHSKTVWVHCASLGEFEQARPLIEVIRSRYPQYKILLSFFSPSGYEIRKNYEAADLVAYLPMDTRKNARDFIAAVDPVLVIFVKYEFWYHYLHTLRDRNIRTMLVSGAFRTTQPFFRWYGSLFREMLRSFDVLSVQDGTSAALLQGIGLGEKTVVTGDTRYDRVTAIAESAVSYPLVDMFCEEHKIVIAGSTWPEDERLLKTYLPHMPPGYRMIIAPHEVSREHISGLRKLLGPGTVLFSELSVHKDTEHKVLVIDNIGMLSSLYRYGALAYIGGGFRKGGIHNILEPSVFGLPVVFGPVFKKFTEANAMVHLQYAFPVRTEAELRSAFDRLIKDEAYRAGLQEKIRSYVKRQTGATARILDIVMKKRLL